MAPPAANNIIRVAARHTFYASSDLINVLHFRILTAATTDPTGSVLALDVSSKLTTAYSNLAAHMSTGVDPVDMQVFNITQDETYGFAAWGGTYTGGTSADQTLPPGVAALYLWRTLTPRVLGKTYLPPFVEASNVGDAWSSGVITSVGTWATALVNEAPLPGGYALQLVVWSRALLQYRLPTARGLAYRPAYQRRRRIGSGS